MQRARLTDLMQATDGSALGLCSTDVAGWSRLANRAQRRLVFARETSDTGFWGAWGRIAFNLSRTAPTFTAPRDVGRIIGMDVCKYPVAIQNEFYEFMEFGVGLMPKSRTQANDRCGLLQAYDRGVVPLFADWIPGNLMRIYPSSADDVGKRVLIGGKDTNDQIVTSLDGAVVVQGEFVEIAAPFADSVNQWNSIAGIQKDETIERVSFYAVDAITATQTLVLQMEPSETTSGYRKYFVNGLPRNCCCDSTSATQLQVDALVKLELIPARTATDYLLVQNIEALLCECQSIRFSEIDGLAAKGEAEERHRSAIRLLNGELTHYEGRTSPAVVFAPFGSASLYRQSIGTML